MRLVFMGTPMFAVPSLKALVEAGHEVLGVFTQPDKPKNREMKLLWCWLFSIRDLTCCLPEMWKGQEKRC